MSYEKTCNFVIIGTKPVMNYVIACLTLFNEGAIRICIRARGRHISKAVDAIEMLRKIFLLDAQVEDISLGTDTIKNLDGWEINVSTIEIIISPK